MQADCGARRTDDVKRMALVIVLMVVGISLMLWAGWHNLRERKLAMQRAQENKMVLVPEQGGATVSPGEGDGPKMTGKAAPGFTLVSLDGKKVSLSDYKGRPVLVNFWATWCGPCKVEMPWFEELRKQYAGQGLEILGLADDVDAGKEAITKVATRAGVTYPILLTDGKVQTAYGGLDVLPMSFYVDKNGVVVVQTAGLGTKDDIEANIKKTIASGGAPSEPKKMQMSSVPSLSGEGKTAMKTVGTGAL
ncbi:TlpA disulfide reductase family protein [Granulicella sp. dw_53]|uniref:TlpA family protein disulfide reductase n=1 Tax=Granulicella sp. dw_53 TaxID=2719792 RepID=UPI0023DE80D1|nr:TlpA disulfide reductase family protein [Granulicella sp. dw_53]